LGKAIGQ
jgi:hypothetical protein